MNWLFQRHQTQPVADAIGALAFVCLAGMALGSLKIRGLGLGPAGVLFAGILTGHFGKPVDHATLDFVKEFGLILFVFTISLPLGPGFFAALRREGLRLNVVVASVVLTGAGLAVALDWVLAFREFGIALFFPAVGLAAGPKFFASVFSSNDIIWLGAGLVVTIVPLLLAGLMARGVWKMNFTVLSGLLAGSVTDPPALAFANNLTKSDAPTVACATVYPLLHILSAQILALALIQ
jgi:uncharacterized transporter YbjL